MKNNYEVIVGNIGSVHQGCNLKVAERKYRAYVKDSKSGIGRAGNESVVLFNNAEPIIEYIPPDPENKMRTVELIVSVDVKTIGDLSLPVERAVRETVCLALDKAKLHRRGWRMSFATVLPYHRPAEKPDYFIDARNDAAATVENFIDEVVEQLMDKGEAGDHLFNDYPNGDRYHHENHTDKDYDLSEAADVLSQLRDNVEDDKGLWEGMEPQRAIAAQAAYTYGNAVYSQFERLIGEINDGWRSMEEESSFLEKQAEENRARLIELESLSKRDRDEFNELRRLRASAKADSEEGVEEAKKIDIRKMVETKIKEFKPC